MIALHAFQFQIATATLEIRFRLEASLLGLQATLMRRNNSGARPRQPNETIFWCNCNLVCQSQSVIAIESRSVTAKVDQLSQKSICDRKWKSVCARKSRSLIALKVGLWPQKSICDCNWKSICDRNESRSVIAMKVGPWPQSKSICDRNQSRSVIAKRQTLTKILFYLYQQTTKSSEKKLFSTSQCHFVRVWNVQSPRSSRTNRLRV